MDFNDGEKNYIAIVRIFFHLSEINFNKLHWTLF